MSPRALDPAVRTAVTEAAIRILATEGRAALSTRRLAREARTSTTAVYTYFGGMDEVHRHVRRAALDELAASLRAAGATDDPVADLARASATHVASGFRDPAMYRVMFVDQPPDEGSDPADAVFALLLELVGRCVRSGRFHPDAGHDPAMWAGEIWASGHGAVMLSSASLLPTDRLSALHADMIHRLCVGFGDDRHRARRSVEAGVHEAAVISPPL
ncbi:TetR/AcrR family transcriptional regulator [Tsukamurella sp. 8F]|uniref:TetR/AcrR family transcriptional regulator n=1 Tax=unclassified Tsukamurella TaxID=2633480 RepID=UPI0023B939BA|nr:MULTISPECIES: TetR/AcrR family transcriptional regulator [unclassified Tsukamurella]MDF0528899.1 TetR/AcrR family transcriptional regulator [Tsukamurella sp. 8J]MDF0586734.1 TetR/AcrR family transcriptional regulator [Tsukamurella sp. 8F]